MTKKYVRLALALALATFALVSSASAAGDCVREVGWTDGNGNPLDCYTCGTGAGQTTYCYPTQ